jgi:hypothetical protein
MTAGRPSKYDSIDLVQVEKLASLGLIDTEIASILGVCEKTLNVYKKKPEFLQAIKKGKDKADAKVIESLYRRATGYEHKEDKIFQHNGEPVIVPTTKHYPPDVTAMIFWLKNRRSKYWRDKQDVEHSGSMHQEISMKELSKYLEKK